MCIIRACIAYVCMDANEKGVHHLSRRESLLDEEEAGVGVDGHSLCTVSLMGLQRGKVIIFCQPD